MFRLPNWRFKPLFLNSFITISVFNIFTHTLRELWGIRIIVVVCIQVSTTMWKSQSIKICHIKNKKKKGDSRALSPGHGNKSTVSQETNWQCSVIKLLYSHFKYKKELVPS